MKSVRKAGRTLLIKSAPGYNINTTIFDNLEGIVATSETKSTKSVCYSAISLSEVPWGT